MPHTQERNTHNIRYLTSSVARHGSCLTWGMQLNTSILRELSFQISSGNPWWGMLLANEYLQSSDYLRKALVARFLARIAADKRCNTTLAQSLIAGRKACQLPDDLRSQIGSRSVRRERLVSLSKDRHERRRECFGYRRSGTVRRRTIAPQFAPGEVAANARTSE